MMCPNYLVIYLFDSYLLSGKEYLLCLSRGTFKYKNEITQTKCQFSYIVIAINSFDIG